MKSSLTLAGVLPLLVAYGLLLMALSGCDGQPKPATTPSSIKAALGGPDTPLPPSEAAQLKAWNAERGQVQEEMAAAHAAGKPLPKVPQPSP